MGSRRSAPARSRDREAAARRVSIGVAEPPAGIARLRAAHAWYARRATVRRRFSSGSQHGESRGVGEALEWAVRARRPRESKAGARAELARLNVCRGIEGAIHVRRA